MRHTTPFAALILILPAAAQQTEAPEFERIWAFFMEVVDQERATPGDGTAILLGTGMSDSGAQSLFEYIQKSVQRANALMEEHVESTCSNKLALQHGGRAGVADKFDADDAKYTAARKDAVDNLDSVINDSDEAAFRAWVNEHVVVFVGDDVRASG